jgi:uracil-DNA glycosylase family 4
MDSLAALRLQVEWGADEALGDEPRDHFQPAPGREPSAAPPARPAPAPPAARGQAAADAASTLDGLHAALDAFDGCPLRAMATATVRPDGNPAARLVLVAEAPGADDDRAGTAFAGPSGQALDRVLGSIGLDRSTMLLTHLVPWRPPGGRAPTEAEIQSCLPFLLRLLHLVRPDRLVLLGAAPARALTGASDSIRRLRGRWLQAALPGADAPIPALPMLPWDQWLRTPAAKRDCWADLLALRQVLDANRQHAPQQV